MLQVSGSCSSHCRAVIFWISTPCCLVVFWRNILPSSSTLKLDSIAEMQYWYRTYPKNKIYSSGLNHICNYNVNSEEVFSGYQPCKHGVNAYHFRDLLCLHQ